MDLWSTVKQTVFPLSNHYPKDLPKRLNVIRKTTLFPTILDLHGYTVQEAFNTTKSFILKSYRQNHREITIITGRGIMGQGLIKNEFDNWLEHKDISDLIIKYNWISNGGAVRIWLKK